MRVIFAGTPEFAVAGLDALLAHRESHGLDIVAVYTQPDRPAGRGRKLKPSPVKQRAQDFDIPVYQPKTLRDADAQAALKALNADLMVVAAYGLILPVEVLEAPTYGCFNIHGSLLPRWRGAAPIHRAILAGDTETGITIMQMDAGLDTGDMLVKVAVPIGPETTTGELHDDLARLGGDALIDAIGQLQAGTLTPEKQDDSLTNYASKLEKAEAAIDWNQPAEQVHRLIRAFNPWPVAQTVWKQDPEDAKQDKTVRIWSARLDDPNSDAGTPGQVVAADKHGIRIACGSGSVLVTELQMPGGKRLKASDFLNSQNVDGVTFG